MVVSLGFKYPDEFIVCHTCKKIWQFDDLDISGLHVTGSWVCPDCTDELRIYVKRGECSPVLTRPNISQLSEGDTIQLMSSYNYDGLHEIIEIKDLYDGTYSVALRSYRKVILNENDWINCRIGMWNSDEDKLFK